MAVACRPPEVLFVRYFVVPVAAGLLLASLFLAAQLRRGGAARAGAVLLLALYLAGNARLTAGLLRCFGKRKEPDLFAFWTAGWTRRPAINSGRAHRENKTTVARSIARQHCRPKLWIIHHLRQCRC